MSKKRGKSSIQRADRPFGPAPGGKPASPNRRVECAELTKCGHHFDPDQGTGPNCLPKMCHRRVEARPAKYGSETSTGANLRRTDLLMTHGGGPRSRPARTPREETPARRTGSADPLLSAAEHYLARRALGSILIVKHYQMGRTNAGDGNSRLRAAIV